MSTTQVYELPLAAAPQASEGGDIIVDNIDIAKALAVLDTKMSLMLEEQKRVSSCQVTDHDRVVMLEGTARVNAGRIFDLEGTRRALTWESRVESLIVAALAAWGLVK